MNILDKIAPPLIFCAVAGLLCASLAAQQPVTVQEGLQSLKIHHCRFLHRKRSSRQLRSEVCR